MLQHNVKPIIFWEGFPVCGLLIKKVAKHFGDDLKILATRPVVPFEGLEEILGSKITWLDDANDIWDRREEFADRNLVVHTGWNHSGWLKFDQWIKKKNNAKIVVVSDNNFRGSFRQYFGALYFRLVLRKYFDGAFTPGIEGRKFLTFLGMPKNRIYTGNYGAYEGVYFETTPILDRNKEFFYVGQLIKRKGVDVLLKAFRSYRTQGGTWNLRIAGTGELSSSCQGDGVIYEGFVQPHHIAQTMNKARVFVLPSRHDNWGTVVCEAAACGMHLITTQNVGASVDIVKTGMNGIELEKLDVESLKEAFHYFENLSNEECIEGSEYSKKIASQFDSQVYYNAIMRMISDLF